MSEVNEMVKKKDQPVYLKITFGIVIILKGPYAKRIGAVVNKQ